MAWSGKSFFEEADPTGNRGRALLLGGFVALIVARTMVPEDPGGKIGLGAPFDVLWIMLAIGWLLGQFRRERIQLHFGLPDALLIALIVWYTIAALVAMQTSSPRPAMNTLWDWIAMGLVFLLGRQLLSSERERRAVVVVMIGLAIGLSAVTVRQEFISIPTDVAAYEAAKDSVEKLYEATGQWLEPGSHERLSFEARLESRLPTATFALSNSLAGFLVPWLVMLCGITYKLQSRIASLVAVAMGALLLYCLWLTGSRTAGVAAVMGMVLVAIDNSRSRILSPRVQYATIGALAASIVAAIALALGTAIGGRAAAAAWRSLAFRIDYWRATLAMIRDDFLVGCGPGQFQDTYTGYKLVSAPEEIQDPHNWLLEIWSTAGTPAAILLLAILCIVFARAWRTSPTSTSEQSEPNSAPSAVLFGGLGGVLLGYAIAWLSGYPLAWLNLLLLMCAIGGAWFLLTNWTKRGSLPLRLPIVAAIALLINLLAAGGISFPAVADSLWLLLALQLNTLEGSSEQVRSLAPPPAVRWLTGLALAVLLFAAIRLHYIPVLNSRLQLSLSDSARAAGVAAAHRNALEAATEADPWSTPAANRLAAQRFADYQSLPTASQIQSLAVADSRVRELAPRNAAIWAQSADFAAAIFRDSGNVEYRRAAEGYYARALALYPSSGELQARAARFWDSIGAAAQARAAAAEALRIDDVMQAAGHRDRVFDTAARLELEALADPPR